MTILCLLTLCGLLVMPQQCIKAAADSLVLCTSVVIPSLFPFFVCSRLLLLSGFVNTLSCRCSKFMKPLFNVNGCGAFALLIGIISGYPVGAKVVASLYEQGNCTKTEAERLLAFCNNSGPLFIIGAVGTGIFKSPSLGFMLYGAHILSALTVGFIFRFYKHNQKASVCLYSRSSTSYNFSTAFQNAINDSLKSVGLICGYVVFFAVVISMLKGIGIIKLLALFVNKNLAIGFLEITNGITQDAPLPAVGFLLSWSGISIIMQVNGIISKHNISILPFIAAKFIQGLFGALYTWFLSTRLSIPVFNINKSPAMNSAEALCGTLIQIMCGISIALLIAFISQLLSTKKR